MAVDITVDDVPESVRDRLTEKAAERSQTLEEYLQQQLKRIAATPSVENLTEKTRRHGQASGRSIPTSEVPAERDADRR